MEIKPIKHFLMKTHNLKPIYVEHSMINLTQWFDLFSKTVERILQSVQPGASSLKCQVSNFWEKKYDCLLTWSWKGSTGKTLVENI